MHRRRVRGEARVKASAPVTGRRMRTVRAVRGAHPGCFALVMSTGIVSAALRQAGSPRSPAVLLAIAAGGFSALAVASSWHAAAFPLTCAATWHARDTAFTSLPPATFLGPARPPMVSMPPHSPRPGSWPG